MTFSTCGCSPSQLRDARARSASWRSMRTCSVFVPRSTRKLSIGDGTRADRVLQERERDRAARASLDDQRAADDVGVAVQVLRHRVRDDVGAELERPLEVRRHERVVDGEQRCRVGLQTCGDRRDVDELQHRVGRRLDPHELRRSAGSPPRPPPRRRSDRRSVNSKPSRRRPCRTGGTCRRRGRRGDDVVAAVEQLQQRRRRREARREAQPADCRPRARRGSPRARSA